MTDSVRPTEETTRKLLDGAIALAESTSLRAGDQPLTAARWAWELVGHWYCAHHSVDLLPEAIERFELGGRDELAAYARLKLEEERGHDQFALNDLESLGYDATMLVHNMPPPPAAEAAVEFARACVRGRHPVEFLGYIYALERRVLSVSDESFAQLQAVLEPAVDAASAIRLHATELDAAHVEEAVRFIASLTADDRTHIARACYRTARISCAAPARQLGEADLEPLLGRGHRMTPKELSSANQ